MNTPQTGDQKTVPSQATRENPGFASILEGISSLIKSLETPGATPKSLQATQQRIKDLLNTLDLLTLTEAQKPALLNLYSKLERVRSNSLPDAESVVGGVLKQIEDIVNQGG